MTAEEQLYLTQVQAILTDNPSAIFQDSWSEVRDWLYRHKLQQVIINAYNNMSPDQQKSVPYKRLPEEIRTKQMQDGVREAMNDAGETTFKVGMGLASLPALLTSPGLFVAGAAGSYLGSEAGGYVGRKVDEQTDHTDGKYETMGQIFGGVMGGLATGRMYQRYSPRVKFQYYRQKYNDMYNNMPNDQFRDELVSINEARKNSVVDYNDLPTEMKAQEFSARQHETQLYQDAMSDVKSWINPDDLIHIRVSDQLVDGQLIASNLPKYTELYTEPKLWWQKGGFHYGPDYGGRFEFFRIPGSEVQSVQVKPNGPYFTTGSVDLRTQPVERWTYDPRLAKYVMDQSYTTKHKDGGQLKYYRKK